MRLDEFSGVNAGHNTNPTINHRFVTAIVKGEPNHWAIRSGDAQAGGLTTVFDGPRPTGYHPMKKQGAILLGIGGDNSVSGAGTFYEGVLTSGYPTAATESAVQATITAAGYGAGGTGSTSGPLHAVGAGKCLDVPNASTTPGVQLQIRGCSGQPGQTWTRTASNQLTVTIGGTTMCLDANGHGTTAGTKVITWSCTGQTNQQWNLDANGTITGAQSGLCLDVTGASTADGAPVELWTCNGGSHQRWTLG